MQNNLSINKQKNDGGCGIYYLLIKLLLRITIRRIASPWTHNQCSGVVRMLLATGYIISSSFSSTNISARHQWRRKRGDSWRRKVAGGGGKVSLSSIEWILLWNGMERENCYFLLLASCLLKSFCITSIWEKIDEQITNFNYKLLPAAW